MAIVAILRWISLISIVYWLIVYWQGGKKVMIDIKESLRIRNSRPDSVLLIIISFCSFVTIVLAFLTNFGLLKAFFPQRPTVIFAGTLLTILGIAGMFYCRHYLGKFWTAETNLHKNHQIVDTGPYRFVRHPIYTFAILMYLGLGLTFLSPENLLFVAAIIAAYILKTNDEDAFLAKNLLGYREYKSRIRYRLIPGLW
ncbi:MAG TPA: isoprenylcysteine carboxylmethyltransferase family protein [Anaerolineales bacterium]|nr:isoprenylcysteine carboxylmethyltransferase family protein [Anaerolineales bacterium]